MLFLLEIFNISSNGWILSLIGIWELLIVVLNISSYIIEQDNNIFFVLVAFSSLWLNKLFLYFSFFILFNNFDSVIKFWALNISCSSSKIFLINFNTFFDKNIKSLHIINCLIWDLWFSKNDLFSLFIISNIIFSLSAKVILLLW